MAEKKEKQEEQSKPPSSLSQEQSQEIIKRLMERGISGICPICGKREWNLADGYFNEQIQAQLHPGLVFGGPTIPSIAIICDNCGFISQHALGALSLLESVKQEEES